MAFSAEIDESLLANSPVISLTPCGHEIVMKDLCAACGTDLRKEKSDKEKCNLKQMNKSKWSNGKNANVQAIHNIPELLISSNVAEKVAQVRTVELPTFLFLCSG